MAFFHSSSWLSSILLCVCVCVCVCVCTTGDTFLFELRLVLWSPFLVIFCSSRIQAVLELEESHKLRTTPPFLNALPCYHSSSRYLGDSRTITIVLDREMLSLIEGSSLSFGIPTTYFFFQIKFFISWTVYTIHILKFCWLN